jgi:hypothetical protein
MSSRTEGHGTASVHPRGWSPEDGRHRSEHPGPPSVIRRIALSGIDVASLRPEASRKHVGSRRAASTGRRTDGAVIYAPSREMQRRDGPRTASRDTEPVYAPSREMQRRDGPGTASRDTEPGGRA